MTNEPENVIAGHGEKMIEVRVCFWTNDIAESEGHIRPRHCWSSGMVTVPHNSSHGISSGDPRPFNSLMELTHAIEQAMIDADIRMHTGRKQGFYV